MAMVQSFNKKDYKGRRSAFGAAGRDSQGFGRFGVRGDGCREGVEGPQVVLNVPAEAEDRQP